jgi:ribonuclease HII
MKPDFRLEQSLIEKGFTYIAGVDEVGRGPVAGPIVAAAVIMNPDLPLIEGIADSKTLNSIKRLKLKQEIINNALAWNIAEIDSFIIDEEGISKSNKKVLNEALAGLSISPNYALIDFFNLDSNILSRGIVRGDKVVYSISCASILAKIYRDDLMVEFSKLYPDYKFEENKGYLTKYHLEAICEHGYCEIHRKSFWPVKEMVF